MNVKIINSIAYIFVVLVLSVSCLADTEFDVPVSEYAKNHKIYDLKKESAKQLNFDVPSDIAISKVFGFYSDYYLSKGYKSCSAISSSATEVSSQENKKLALIKDTDLVTLASNPPYNFSTGFNTEGSKDYIQYILLHYKLNENFDYTLNLLGLVCE